MTIGTNMQMEKKQMTTANNFWSTIEEDEEISGLVLPPQRGYYLVTPIIGEKRIVLFNGVYWQSSETQMPMPIANWYYDPDPANIMILQIPE